MGFSDDLGDRVLAEECEAFENGGGMVSDPEDVIFEISERF